MQDFQKKIAARQRRLDAAWSVFTIALVLIGILQGKASLLGAGLAAEEGRSRWPWPLLFPAPASPAPAPPAAEEGRRSGPGPSYAPLHPPPLHPPPQVWRTSCNERLGICLRERFFSGVHVCSSVFVLWLQARRRDWFEAHRAAVVGAVRILRALILTMRLPVNESMWIDAWGSHNLARLGLHKRLLKLAYKVRRLPAGGGWAGGAWNWLAAPPLQGREGGARRRRRPLWRADELSCRALALSRAARAS